MRRENVLLSVADFEDDFEAQPSKVNNEPGKANNVPVFPKEEELSEEELEKMVQERYKPGSSYVTYADDRLTTVRAVGGNEGLPSYKDPTIWKVKCMIGREKQSVFCLMQKFVELKSLGNKLDIISAFSVENVKGFIYIEAERQSVIYEACKGVSTIYSSRVAPVPKNEVSSTLSARSKSNAVSVGSWARVKNGKYRGDIAQVVAVNDTRNKATVKLVPRIDLQVLAEKYGGGVSSKKRTFPAPRLVSSSELEEFRPLIQYKRDRESGLAFEVLDGMMLKDGYLYKKVSMDSLNLYGVIPSKEELLKFESSKNEAPDCHEWLTELYGEKKKEPRIVQSDKGGSGKGEGSSSSSLEANFLVGDLVLFNKKDFGVIVGSEKDEYYKILKEGSEGPVMVTIDVRQLKKASFENRFTALDKHKKMISINDTVRILEGPLEARQGNVKHIYRGIIFLHDEVELENNGYFCCKSQICEKVKFSKESSKGKEDGESSFPAFDNPPSSPKSPLAPAKPWEIRERNSNFNREEQEGMFTVGQSLRIRVGPLKGYLCRVLAIRRTGVTVKLDSQHKILTVKSEHLAEVRGRSSAIPMSDDKDAKPFDMLGNPDGSADWMTGVGTSADGERSSWPAFPSSGTSAQPGSNSAMDIDNKDEGDDGWGSKVTPKPSSAWGNTATDQAPAVNNEQAGGWGNSGGNWGNKSKTSTEDQGGSSQDAGGNWGKPKTSTDDQAGSAGGWGSGGGNWGNKPKTSAEDQGGSFQDAGRNWGSKPNSAPSNEGPLNSWGTENSAKSVDKVSEDGNSSGSIGGWGDAISKSTTQTAAWGKSTSDNKAENWGNTDSKKDDASPGFGKTSDLGGSWSKTKAKDDGSAPAWDKTVDSSNGGQGGSWGKKDEGSAPAWGKTVQSSDGGQGGSWGKKDEGKAPAWGNKTVDFSDRDQGGSWRKNDTKKDGNAPAWGKTVESSNGGQGGSWAKKDEGSAPAWGKTVESFDGGQSGSWSKNDEGSAPAWGKAVESPDSGQGGSWGKSNTKKDNSAPAWGKAVDSDGTSGKSAEDDSWGKASKAWGSQDDSSEKKVGWNSSAPEGSSWGKGGGGGSSWGRQNDGNSEGGYGGWNKGNGEQQDGGSSGDFGGRRGRGGWRGGGRGGRSFGGDDQGAERGGRGGRGWSDGGGRGGDRGGFRGRGRSDYGSGGGFGGRGRGRRDENSDWGNNQNDDKGQSWGSNGGGGWSKGNGFDDGGGSSSETWKKPGETNGASGGSSWNSGSGSGGNWNKPAEAGQPSILGTPKDAAAKTGAGGGSGWGNSSSTGNEEGGSSSSQWGKPAGGGGGSSAWGKGNDSGSKGGGW